MRLGSSSPTIFGVISSPRSILSLQGSNCILRKPLKGISVLPAISWVQRATFLAAVRRDLSASLKDPIDYLRVYNLKVDVSEDPGKDAIIFHEALAVAIEKKLQLKHDIKLSPDNVKVVRKAFDARRRDKKCWVYVVDVSLQVLHRIPKEIPGQVEYIHVTNQKATIQNNEPHDCHHSRKPVVVVGTGPAGLFAALRVAEEGIPVVLLERGQPVEVRGRDIGAFFVRKQLNPESNLCYGEGGAGTWSDGKLTTRIGRNDDPVRQVLGTLCEFGAPEGILYAGKPHLGTDRLVKILQAFRTHLHSIGVEIRFSAKVCGLKITRNRVSSVILEDGNEIEAEACVLAVGHSARDLYEHLHSIGAGLESKPFAVGFRIEHPQALIDKIQYGEKDALELVKRGRGPIPVADYRLTATDPRTGRGTYSFCMCPGGQIVPTSTSEDELCINGMSFSRRNSSWANSALVTSVDMSDCKEFSTGNDPLSGVKFQKYIEREAARMGGGHFICPVQKASDYLENKLTKCELPSSSYRLGVKSAPLHALYPEAMTAAIKNALMRFDQMKPGFINERALLHAAETRTSAPVKILRDSCSFESVTIQSLYPAGEGAGYAGGIVSAAVDGIKVGEAIIRKLK